MGLITNKTEADAVGVVTDQTAVTITVNGQPATVAPGTAGKTSFTATTPLATEGSNTVTIHAVDAAGNATDSVRTVLRDTQAPVVTLDALPDSVLYRKDSVMTITGTITDQTAVTANVNGVPLAVDSSTHAFSQQVTLAQGIRRARHGARRRLRAGTVSCSSSGIVGLSRGCIRVRVKLVSPTARGWSTSSSSDWTARYGRRHRTVPLQLRRRRRRAVRADDRLSETYGLTVPDEENEFMAPDLREALRVAKRTGRLAPTSQSDAEALLADVRTVRELARSIAALPLVSSPRS